MKILLIITGSVAAYKTPLLIRLLCESDCKITPVLTKGGAQFVTPLTISSLSGHKVRDDLFNLEDEAQFSHIQLARDCDLIVVCPASANFIGRLRLGLCDDLATTLMMAADCPVLIAPAMNPKMWSNAAMIENIAVLKQRGMHFVEPEYGKTACGEIGAGRLSDIELIYKKIMMFENPNLKPLAGLNCLVTAGPTREKIDPVRVLSNISSGKQGYAIAQALIEQGAKVTLISGPVNLSPPDLCDFIQIETAEEMNACVERFEHIDLAICCAAVSDWRIKNYSEDKIKKNGQTQLSLELIENKDILEKICKRQNRPSLIIGFAAESNHIVEYAKEKRIRKGCDWMVGNDISSGTIGGDANQMYLIRQNDVTRFEKMSKLESARRLVKEIIEFYKTNRSNDQIKQ
ncbi:MAG: bifunctional phosphopantothenoylcysteine decarboxylase/phosphopantothenate--cysteine ligase CoaBC [Pseudomonadota bacterium]